MHRRPYDDAEKIHTGALWQQVHRAGGYATVGLGIVIAITGALLTHEVLGAVVSAAALCAVRAVVVSYRKYART